MLLPLLPCIPVLSPTSKVLVQWNRITLPLTNPLLPAVAGLILHPPTWVFVARLHGALATLNVIL